MFSSFVLKICFVSLWPFCDLWATYLMCVCASVCVNVCDLGRCRPGFIGPVCQHLDPCHRSPCLNRAVCRSQVVNGLPQYTCVCQRGFRGECIFYLFMIFLGKFLVLRKPGGFLTECMSTTFRPRLLPHRCVRHKSLCQWGTLCQLE